MQVAHVFEVVILALAHHAVRLPEFLPFEHLRDGGIESDGVAHLLSSCRDGL